MYNWMANESAITNVTGEDFTAATNCIEESYQTPADIEISDFSDSENENDNELWGTDAEVMTVSSFTRPSTPRCPSDYGCDSNESPRGSETQSDTFLQVFSDWSQICSSPRCTSLEARGDSGLGSPAYNSTNPSPRLSRHLSRDDYFGFNVPDSAQHDDNHFTFANDTRMVTPTYTPAVATPSSSIGEQLANMQELSIITLQPLNVESETLRSRSTSIVVCEELEGTLAPPHQVHVIGAAEDNALCSVPNEPQSGQEIPPRVPTDEDEDFSNISHPEPGAEVLDPVQNPPIPRRQTSGHSFHSVYITAPIPRLYYRHDSPSCWSILGNLLTDPIHRIRARKRSVRESAAKDQELRQLHAQMKETEMRMRQGGTQPPQYTDVTKDGANTTRHEARDIRTSREGR